MTAFSFTKQGAIFPTTSPAYYPCIIDTSGVTDWPWTVTVYASTDHGAGGIYMYGAVGDPTVLGNWETYDAGLAAGHFDAFGTKPGANPIYIDADTSDAETPHIVKVGSTWILTCHDEVASADQPTRAATATTAPLNFTRLANADDGKILNGNAAPLNDYPGNANRGYFRWGANPFSGVAYDYIGYGLSGAGNYYHFAMYGSDDGTTWTLITLLNQTVGMGLTATYGVVWNMIDPQSIRDAGNGEYVALCSVGPRSSGATSVARKVYEIYIAADGYTLTRQPRLVIDLGGVGDDDEDEVSSPTTLLYGGTLLCVYQGTDGANANSLMLATGSVTATAAKPTAITYPNHTKESYTLSGSLAALPAGLTKDGSGTLLFNADELRLPGTTGVSVDTAFTPSTAGWVELEVVQYTGSDAATTPIIQATDTGPGAGNNGVYGVSYTGISNLIEILSRDNAATIENKNTVAYNWKNDPAKHHIGLRWDVANDILYWLGGGRSQMDSLAVPGAEKAVSCKLRVGAAAGTGDTAELSIASLVARIGTSSGGVAPTATWVADDTTVTGTLSEDCVGDGTGLSVTADASAVDGTWTRTGLTNLTFTRTSGTFYVGQTIEVAVSGTDIRNAADLVAVQDATTEADNQATASGGGGGLGTIGPRNSVSVRSRSTLMTRRPNIKTLP